MKTIQYRKYGNNTPLRIAAEPEVLYVARKTVDLFPIGRFQELSGKLSFTQIEWADILHISDRTLQRYLKEGKPFEGLYAEHLYQLENMCELGMEVFGSVAAFEDPDLIFHIDDQQLKADWMTDISYSQWIGEQILSDPMIIAFTAPSAVVPSERNVILNPLAKQFRSIEFLPAVPFSTDLRLLAKLLS